MRHRIRYAAVLAAAAAVLATGPAATAGAAAHPAAASDDWPTFGHDGLHSGVSTDTAIGASSASSLAVRWSQPLGSNSDQPSPMVAYNASLKQTLVYDVTFAGVARAFNASTGALVWQHKTAPNVYSSPAIYGNTMYFGNNEGMLEALNATTGAVQCTFTLPDAPSGTTPDHIFSSPVVGQVDATGPTVFFGSTSQTHTGYLWAVSGVGSTLGGCQQRWGYDSWRNKGKGDTWTGVWSEPALAQESGGTWAVVFGSANPDDAVYALKAVSGARLWRFQAVSNGPDQDVGAGAAISAPGGNGFAAGVAYVEGKNGIEYALNLGTGQQIWSRTLGPGSNSAIAVSETALTGNTLAVGYAGSLFTLNATTGAVLWQATPGGTVQAAPAISGAPGDQAVFVGDVSGGEYGYSLASGTQLFSAATSAKIQDSTAIAGGTLYFAAQGTLYAYAPPG